MCLCQFGKAPEPPAIREIKIPDVDPFWNYVALAAGVGEALVIVLPDMRACKHEKNMRPLLGGRTAQANVVTNLQACWRGTNVSLAFGYAKCLDDDSYQCPEPSALSFLRMGSATMIAAIHVLNPET